MSEISTWLSAILAQNLRPVANPVPGRSAPAVGDLWLVTPEDGDAERRHLLLVGRPAAHLAQVLLCSGIDIDLLTDTDTVIGPRQTGLPYALLVHGDLTAPVPTRLLSQRLGHISVSSARRLVWSGISGYGRGLPIRSRSDVRWEWKLAELAYLQTIMASPEELGV